MRSKSERVKIRNTQIQLEVLSLDIFPSVRREIPSVRRGMFIDDERHDAALRQEGHVNGEG